MTRSDPEPRTLRNDIDRALERVRERAGRPSGQALRARVRTTTTARRLVVIGLATFLPLVVVSVMLGSALTRTAELTDDVSNEVETLVAPVLQLSDALAETRVLLDRYFTTAQEHDQTAFIAYARRIDTGFADIREVVSTGDDEMQAQLRAAEDSWEFIRDMAADPEFVVPPDAEARNALFATLSSTISSIRRDLVEVADLAASRIVTLATQAEATAGGMRVLLFTAVPAALLAGIVLIGWLVRDLRSGSRELREAAEALERGAGSVRVTEGVSGELAPIARAFNAMAERLERQARELHATANRDELTGVMNRRGFRSDLDAELERAGRYGRPTALLILDIDHFKTVNDTWGHPVGDVVLKAVADEIQDAVRGVDRVGRWGGEEFAVLLPETPPEDARHVAERINRVIRQRVVIAAGEAIRVTASLGVAIFDPANDAEATPDELVSRADAALYAAKSAGRDRVMFAS